VTLLLGALLLIETGRPHLGAVAFAASVLTKGFALAALPALLLRRRDGDGAAPHRPGFGSRLPVTAWLAAALLVVACALPFALAGGGILDSILRYGRDMHYNDGLADLMRRLFGPDTTRPLLVAGWLGWAALVVRRRENNDLFHQSALLIAGLLIVAPTVHPWYLMTLLPFLCVLPWWGWLAFSGTVALTWLPHLEIQQTGRWVEWPLLKVPEYAPLVIWLLVCAWRASKRTNGAENP
jgi:hypothetical protein